MPEENYDITKPFPNEHSCRLHPPNYPKYRRQNCAVKHAGKCIDFIFGIKGPNESELQAMRYSKDVWDAAAARAHCKEKKGSFEPAGSSAGGSIGKMEIFLKSEGHYVKNEMSDDDFLNWFKSNSDEEGNVKEDCMLYKRCELDENEKAMTFVMSDFTLDRDFERIDPAGWDLKAYRKINVLLWAHDRNLPAIGTMEKVRVKDEKLIGEALFDDDDEFAQTIKKKVEKKIIKSGSVGFFPLKVELIDDSEDKCRIIYRKQELREFSLCNVPANPNAMIIEPDKSIEIETGLKERIEKLKEDVEDLKEMQIMLSEKIDKKEINPLDSLFKKKGPQPEGLQTFLKGKRSIDHNPISNRKVVKNMADENKIDSPEKLQAWVDNTENFKTDMNSKLKAKDEEVKTLKEENTNLRKEISDLGNLIIIRKGSWKETDEQKRWNYELGKWWARFRKGFGHGSPTALKHLRALDLSKLAPTYEKADLGTPITGDATGTDAQYLVPQTIYEQTILKTLMQASEVIPKFQLKTMTGRLHRYAVEGTRITLTFVTDEVTDKTESNPTWTKVDLEAETYATWIGVTDELLEDTFAEIGAQISEQGARAYKNAVETQLLDGSGSPVTGILRNGSVNVKRTGSVSILNLDWDDIKTLIEGLSTQEKRQGAVFVMHPTIWDILISDKDAQGRYFWDVSQAGPRTAKGYPVLLCDNMPDTSTDTADKAFICFGNLYYVLFGIRMGLEFRYFDQTQYALVDDENFWRLRTRFAGVVGIPANLAVLKTLAS